MRSALAGMRISHLQRPVQVTASFGVAWSHSDDGAKHSSPSELLAAADRALYQAKRAGRNCVQGSSG